MNFLVPVAVALFVPLAYQAIRTHGPRRGVVYALLGGWLFLPVFDGRLQLPFVSTKMTFVGTGVLLAAAAIDYRRLAGIRWHWPDLAVALLCFGPFATALSNDLGAYEGFSASVYTCLAWGTPYVLGRAYLGNPRAVRDLAVATVGAALVYVPLCLWEIRMSPQLHRQLYGYHTFENFGFAIRFGGYRPTVFMQFGLMVGTFMASGALVAYWLWRSGAVTRLRGVKMSTWTAVLAGTTVLVKSTGAIILLAVGIVVLELTRRVRNPLPILVLTLLPIAFATARIGGWTGRELSQIASLVNEEREQSVSFRLMQEERLLEKALQRPWLGWGRFGRSRVFDEDGRDISVTDSLWIIALGMTGVVGLAGLGLMLALPVLLVLARYPARRWSTPALAPAASLAIVTTLWAVDCLLNAMTSPLFPAMCGSLVTLASRRWASLRAPPVPAARGRRVPPAVPAT